MRIEFHEPVDFCLDLLETEERIPSMQVEIQIAIKQMQHIHRYEGILWIECSQWENFTKALTLPVINESVFCDMSNVFVLKINKKGNGGSLSWEFKRTNIEGEVMLSNFCTVMTDDMLCKIREQFTEFPVWW